MDKLWAPWRSGYIYRGASKKCIFCGNRGDRTSKERFIIDRSKHAFSMLNLYPYNTGHILVAPYRHIRDIEDLKADELKGLMDLVIESKRRIDKALKPSGYNIGINTGQVAGAGFAGHIHIHVVPRWSGDTNFMPVVSNTKVISDSLKAVHRKLTC